MEVIKVIKIEPRRDGRYNLFWSDGDKTICDKNSLWLYEQDVPRYAFDGAGAGLMNPDGYEVLRNGRWMYTTWPDAGDILIKIR